VEKLRDGGKLDNLQDTQEKTKRGAQEKKKNKKGKNLCRGATGHPQEHDTRRYKQRLVVSSRVESS